MLQKPLWSSKEVKPRWRQVVFTGHPGPLLCPSHSLQWHLVPPRGSTSSLLGTPVAGELVSPEIKACSAQRAPDGSDKGSLDLWAFALPPYQLSLKLPGIQGQRATSQKPTKSLRVLRNYEYSSPGTSSLLMFQWPGPRGPSLATCRSCLYGYGVRWWQCDGCIFSGLYDQNYLGLLPLTTG